jgi:hypothetical protein
MSFGPMLTPKHVDSRKLSYFLGLISSDMRQKGHLMVKSRFAGKIVAVGYNSFSNIKCE